VICCVPAFLAAFDFGFMVLAGPRLGADLAAGGAYPWLFSAASFAYGAVVMPAGARFAPSRGLVAGLALAAAGCALVAVAGALPVALAGRVAFGLGGGIAAPAALAMLARRGTGFSALGAAVALGFACGVIVAAVAPWRAALGVMALATVAAAASAAARSDSRTVVPPLTPRGAAWFAAATLALAGALAAHSPFLGLVAAALAAVATRRASPWLPDRRVAAVLLAAAATTASGVGAMVVLGRSLAGDPAAAPVLAAFGIAAVPAARLNLGARTASAGLAVQALGLIGVALSANVIVVAVFGAGHVLANAGVAERATALAGEHVAAVAGLLVTAQFAGSGVGALVIAGIDARHGPATAGLAAAAIASTGAIVAGHHRALVHRRS